MFDLSIYAEKSKPKCVTKAILSQTALSVRKLWLLAQQTKFMPQPAEIGMLFQRSEEAHATVKGKVAINAT